MAKEAILYMNRIQKISKLFRAFCIFVLVIYAVGSILSIYAIWSGSSIVHTNIYVKGMGLQHAKDFSTGGKFFMTLWMLVIFAYVFKGFHHLKNLFSSYSKGKIFSSDANGQIKKFGITVCLYPVLEVLCILLSNIAVYLTYEIPVRMINTPPDKSVSIITPLIIGAAIIYISWVMEMGRELREDQELTI